MREERHSTTSEKIMAAASVASAAAAAKTAMEATKAREEMEDMNKIMRIAAENQRRIQLAMASDQSENNFRNTVLAALPLLKSDQDRIQFLTEQFVPKLKNTEESFFYFPVEWVTLSETKNNDIETYLDGDGGKELKQHLVNGKELLARKADWDNRVDETEDAEKRIRKIQNPIRTINLIKSILWGFLFYVAMVFFPFSGWIPFLMACAFGFTFQLVLNFLKIEKLKSKIGKLTPPPDNKPASTEEKAQTLGKELDLLDSKWEAFKSQIARFLIEEYKPIITEDARAVILECVGLRIKEGVRDLQSFLPPSVRLPASHYAQFLFDDDDVENFKTEQNQIAKLLVEKLEPDYENETVVWIDDSNDSNESEDLEDSDGESEDEDEKI